MAEATTTFSRSFWHWACGLFSARTRAMTPVEVDLADALSISRRETRDLLATVETRDRRIEALEHQIELLQSKNQVYGQEIELLVLNLERERARLRADIACHADRIPRRGEP